MAPPPDDAGITAGARVGRYELLARIGAGGMGAVWKARHAELGHKVALKVLDAKIPDEAARARFAREGKLAARVRHPNVVQVLDAGEHGGHPYLVMDLIDGETLGAYVARAGALPVPEVVALMLPVLDAVAAAHDAGVIHRDLKPENVLLTRDRDGAVHPVVVDFGVARLDAGAPANSIEIPAVTETATMVGTAVFMAPEQMASARDADARSDQYALGAVLYTLATGRRPFEGGSVYELTFKVVGGACEPPRKVRPELPEALDAVIRRAMRVTPAKRFSSVRALGAALLPFAAPEVAARWSARFPATNEVIEDTPAPRRRRVALAVLGLAAAAVLAARFVPRGERAPTAPVVHAATSVVSAAPSVVAVAAVTAPAAVVPVVTEPVAPQGVRAPVGVAATARAVRAVRRAAAPAAVVVQAPAALTAEPVGDDPPRGANAAPIVR